MLNYIIDIITNSFSIKIDSEIDKRIIREELRAYGSNLYNRLRVTKNYLYRKEPIDTYQNYLPLTLSSGNDKIKIIEPSEFIQNFSKVIILGTAGSGKTTLLRYITLRCIDQEELYPIYIELRNYNKSTSFSEFVGSIVSDKYKGEILDVFKIPKFIFILDGYDEIDYTSGIETIYQIEKFISKYDSNKFIISSRKGTNIESLSQFKVFEIRPLSQNDIVKYVERLRLPVDKTNKFYDHLKSDLLSKHYLTTPLLLSVYINYVMSTNDFEMRSNSSIFFRNIVDTLFSRHDSVSKLGFVRNRLSGLTKDELESVSSTLAFRAFIQNINHFTLDSLNADLSKIKDHLSLIFENEKLVYDLTITVNILIRDGNYYFFPHILIQEYFAALFISRLPSYAKRDFYTNIPLKNKIRLSPTILSFLYEIDKQSFLKNYLKPSIEKEDFDNLNYNFIIIFLDNIGLKDKSRRNTLEYIESEIKDFATSSNYLKDILDLE